MNREPSFLVNAYADVGDDSGFVQLERERANERALKGTAGRGIGDNRVAQHVQVD